MITRADAAAINCHIDYLDRDTKKEFIENLKKKINSMIEPEPEKPKFEVG